MASFSWLDGWISSTSSELDNEATRDWSDGGAGDEEQKQVRTTHIKLSAKESPASKMHPIPPFGSRQIFRVRGFPLSKDSSVIPASLARHDQPSLIPMRSRVTKR